MAKTRINATAEQIALYIIENRATRRQTAEHFGISKSTVDNYVGTLTGDLAAMVDTISKENKRRKPATVSATPNPTITVSVETTTTVKGNRVSKNSHPVMCIETGEIYASGADAAEDLGVTQGAVSQQIIGYTPTVKGRHFCKVSDAKENIGAISASIKTANAKAETYKAETETIRVAATEAIEAAKAETANVTAKYNSIAEKLSAIATIDKEIAELEQRLAEAKANREIIYRGLFE